MGPTATSSNSFADTVAAMHPMYALRVVGGLLYLSLASIGHGLERLAHASGPQVREETPMTETLHSILQRDRAALYPQPPN